MGLKRRNPTQSGESQPPTKKKATKKKVTTKGVTETKSIEKENNPPGPSEPAPDDFNDYQSWVRKAIGDDIPSDLIVDHWNTLEAEDQADFAKAVRGYSDAKVSRAAADSKLFIAADATLTLPDMTAGNRVSRKLITDAKRHHAALDEALNNRVAVNKDVLSNLEALDSALKTSSSGVLVQQLQAYHQELLSTLQAELSNDQEWRRMWEVCSGKDWIRSTVETLMRLAHAIRDTHPSRLPASNEGSQASPNETRGHEDEDVESEATHADKDSAAPPTKSALAGANQSQQPDAIFPHEQQQDNEQDRATAREGQHRDDSEPPGLPAPGNRGQHATEFARVWKNESSTFKSWCRRQLLQDPNRTVEDTEALAGAFMVFWTAVASDHDWENEEDVPRLPFSQHDFVNRWPAGHHWPNVRRLLRMTENGSDACKLYVSRLVYDGRALRAGANLHALTVIDFIKQYGLDLDWANVADVENFRTSSKFTQTLDLQDLNRQGHWNPSGVIGRGGNGRAVIYLKYNQHGRIMERIVSKESFIGKSWNHPDSWYGDVNNRVPFEAGLHSLMPNNRHVIEYLGFHVNKQLRMIRLYTAFAQLGDLWDLLNNHIGLAGLRDEQGISLKAKSLVPKTAILYFFEAMAASACLMAHGALPDDKGTWPGGGGEGNSPEVPWTHNIIHQDIKLNNYFVSTSSDDLVWPGLPVVALGDFGNGIDAAKPVFTRHPQLARGFGTPNWMAPEQIDMGADLPPVSSATNVYQAGLCILAIMSRSFPLYQPTFVDKDRDLFDPTSLNHYDLELVDLALSCVEIDPSKRPSAKQLYLYIRALATEYPHQPEGHGIPYQFMRLSPGESVLTRPDGYAHLLA